MGCKKFCGEDFSDEKKRGNFLLDDSKNMLEEKATLTVGQRNIKFGKYTWRVLDIWGTKALLLAENILEKRTYHQKFECVTWEKCDLRKYLNGEFLQNFSGEEQARIVHVANKNPDNPWYRTEGGNSTLDRVFLLSINEIVKYFGDSGQLWKRNTEGYIDDQYNSERIAADAAGKECFWWLRSPGGDNHDAAYIDGGSIGIRGYAVDDSDDISYGGVRPALWLDFSQAQ